MTAPRFGHDVCVIVPAYNEASVLANVVAALRVHFARVVCVDDGSSDATADVAAAAGATVLRHGVNLGQGAALETGFSYVRRHPEIAYAITFDGDGQHLVEDAVRAVATCREEGLDVVLGSRNLGRTHGQTRGRRLLLAAALKFSRATTGLALTDTHNGLRALSRRAVERIQLTHAGMTYASELESLIASSGLAWREIGVEIHYTDYSRSKGQHGINAVNIVCELATSRLGLI